MREELRHGGALSAALIGRSWQAARVTALVPTRTDSRHVYSFNDALPFSVRYNAGVRGQIIPSGPLGTAVVIGRMSSHLASRPDAVCLLEDRIARPTDPPIAQAIDVVFAGDTVVRVLTRSGDRVQAPSDDAIGKALESATSYALVAALTYERNAIDLLRPQSQLSQDDLSRMADRVVAIVVLAYDGEGYLIATFPSGARRSSS